MAMPPGCYTLVQLVNVSRSLAAQLREPADPQPAPVHKAVLARDGAHCVAYFVDPIDFGPGTELVLGQAAGVPLLKAAHYTVRRRCPYAADAAILGRLAQPSE